MRSFLALLCLAVSTIVSANQKIIIDTDPGIDDLLAISLAIKSPEVDILGITTVFGNVTTLQATNNALTLVEYFDQKIPVYEGAYMSLEGDAQNPPAFVHGKDGLGELFMPLPSLKPQVQTAAHFIVETIHKYPNQVIILALGPQTNLAEALELDPSIADLVKEVVMMGGAFETKGNISSVSEANIWHDPHAAQIVAKALWPKVYLGLDVTEQLLLSDTLLLEIADIMPLLGNFLYDASQLYFDFHKNYYQIQGKSFMHDPAAFLYLTHPQAFKTKAGSVDVSTEAANFGQTVLSQSASKYHAKICYQVDAPMILEAFKSTMLEDRQRA